MAIKTLIPRSDKLIIYTDGGARGNPGPAALGVVIGEKEYAEYLGEMTNNQAEYRAVLFALKKTKQLLGSAQMEIADIEVRIDAELIVKQLNGEYKIKEPELKMLFVDIWNARMDFKRLTFTHIPREKNRRADALVNKALDARR